MIDRVYYIKLSCVADTIDLKLFDKNELRRHLEDEIHDAYRSVIISPSLSFFLASVEMFDDLHHVFKQGLCDAVWVAHPGE